MKGNKMSAILAILIMLSGALAIAPIAHSQPAPGWVEAVGANVQITQSPPATPNGLTQTSDVQTTWAYPFVSNINFVAGVNGSTGTKFWVDVDAYNVSLLSTFGIGFTYNPSLLTVLDVEPTSSVAYTSSVLKELTPSESIGIPGSFSTPGQVSVYAWSSTDSYTYNSSISAQNNEVNLMSVEFNITGTSSYINSIIGVPQKMMGFAFVPLTTGVSFLDEYSNALTPTLTNGTITYIKPPPGPVKAPTAKSTIAPNPTTIVTPQVFSASGSLPGFNGTTSVPITNYTWTYNSIIVKSGPTAVTWTNQTSKAGSYSVTLTVTAFMVDNATYNYTMSDSEIQIATVYPKATGCAISLYTQSWRYVDPSYIWTSFVGDLNPTFQNGSQADTFRPGDLVQLYANVTYNGAPVSNALVTFQVFDNNNNSVLVAEATSNCYGLAEWDFRIPWPSTEGTLVNNSTQGSFGPAENTELFGMWSAVVTWQLGSQYTEEPPFEKTQAATIKWDVSWGLTISIISVTPNPTMRGPASCGYGNDTVVKVNVANEYLEPVLGLVTVTLYDNLLVPIYPPAQIWTTWAVGNSQWNSTSILIPSYAFVGTGYAVANLLTTNPLYAGTAFCPEAWTTFYINPYS